MKRKVAAIVLSGIFAFAAATALWAGDQGTRPCCDKAQKAAQQGEGKCICAACAEGKKDAACTCGCNTSKGCDMKGCPSCAKKEKSQQRGCCDR